MQSRHCKLLSEVVAAMRKLAQACAGLQGSDSHSHYEDQPYWISWEDLATSVCLKLLKHRASWHKQALVSKAAIAILIMRTNPTGSAGKTWLPAFV